MARIRTIKPSFFKNEDLAELPVAARLLFIGLWCLADKEGRLEDRPKRIKAELFPYESLEVDQQLSRLQSAGFIIRYTASGGKLTESGFGELKVIQIINFSKHQRITGSEATSESDLPEYEGSNEETTWKHFGNTKDDGKGKERIYRKGKEDDVSNIIPEVIFPFVSENFKSIWDHWKEYKKKEYKFIFKSAQSEQAALSELAKISKGEELAALEIIQRSMANGWKGFFELKNEKNGTGNSTNGKSNKSVNGEQLDAAHAKYFNQQ